MNKKINIELDYPLGENRKTLHDIKISSEIFNLQEEADETADQPTIKRNFQRASELVKISDERILEIYNSLRPNKSSKEELLAIADELENKYGAVVNANFVREVAEIYEKRGKLRKD